MCYSGLPWVQGFPGGSLGSYGRKREELFWLESQCLAFIPAAAVGCAPRLFLMCGTGFSILPEAENQKHERNFYWGMALELEVIFKSALPGVKRSRKLELIAQWGSGELQGTVASILNGGIWPKPWADHIWIISNHSRASSWQVDKKHLRFQKLHCLAPEKLGNSVPKTAHLLYCNESWGFLKQKHQCRAILIYGSFFRYKQDLSHVHLHAAGAGLWFFTKLFIKDYPFK